jgi:hypothetical protein
MNNRKDLEYVRDRIRNLVNGDRDVDVGTILYMLNGIVKEIGGNSVELKPHEIERRFFAEIDND